MSEELVKRESVDMIVSQAPQSYESNKTSLARCTDAGQALLDTIEAAGGMTDELDAKAANFIVKAKRTVEKMNEQRSPVTKLFDQIRKAFTEMENAIDVNKSGNVVNKLQLLRNEYAAKKRAEEEARRQAELEKQRAFQAKRDYATAVEENYRQQANAAIITRINQLNALDASVTVDNSNDVMAKLKAFPCEITPTEISAWRCTARVPACYLTINDCQTIQRDVLASITQSVIEQSRFDVASLRDDILDRLPSKVRQLQLAAQASAEEAERIKAELARREAEEAMRREEERKRKEAEEQAKKEMQAKQANLDNLFGQAGLQTESYQPKTRVKKVVTILSADAFPQILSAWWSKEGQYLDIAELAKIFKKQITFVEKMANDKSAPELIEHPSIRYDEDVKAK